MVQRVTERAGVDLQPAGAWLLIRLAEDPGLDIDELSARYDVIPEAAYHGLRELEQRGLVQAAEEPGGPRPTTAAGRDTVEKLIAARREGLARLCEGWPSDDHAELAHFLTRLAGELASDPPEREVASAAAR
jgi:DNA-binding MarR family transcriptional regulator